MFRILKAKMAPDCSIVCRNLKKNSNEIPGRFTYPGFHWNYRVTVTLTARHADFGILRWEVEDVTEN